MSLTSNYVELLLTCQVDELNSVTTYTDGEVLVLFLLWVLHRILELVDSEYVHVQVVRPLVEVAIQYTYQCLGTLLIVVTESTWTDGLSIRDTIESILVWQLSYRVQLSQKTVLLCTVRWVSTWSQRSTSWTTIRHVAGVLTVYYI